MNTKIKVSGACVAVVLLLMLLTEPSEIHPIVLVVPFLLIFACLFLLFYSVLQLRYSGLRSVWMAFAASSLPVILLAMQSLGQLGVGDVFTLLVLYSVLYLYMSRVVVSEK